jgi:hypothetical protein
MEERKHTAPLLLKGLVRSTVSERNIVQNSPASGCLTCVGRESHLKRFKLRDNTVTWEET